MFSHSTQSSFIDRAHERRHHGLSSSRFSLQSRAYKFSLFPEILMQVIWIFFSLIICTNLLAEDSGPQRFRFQNLLRLIDSISNPSFHWSYGTFLLIYVLRFATAYDQYSLYINDLDILSSEVDISQKIVSLLEKKPRPLVLITILSKSKLCLQRLNSMLPASWRLRALDNNKATRANRLRDDREEFWLYWYEPITGYFGGTYKPCADGYPSAFKTINISAIFYVHLWWFVPEPTGFEGTSTTDVRWIAAVTALLTVFIPLIDPAHRAWCRSLRELASEINGRIEQIELKHGFEAGENEHDYWSLLIRGCDPLEDLEEEEPEDSEEEEPED